MHRKNQDINTSVARALLVGVSLLTLIACGGAGGGGIKAPDAPLPPAPIVLEPDSPENPESWRGQEYNNSSGFDLINAAEAYASRTTGETGGKGVRIAILDNGIDATHPDLAGAVVYKAVIEPDNVLGDHHGTNMAGIAGARRHENQGFHLNRMGVAYAADLVDIRVSTASNQKYAAVGAGIASAAGLERTFMNGTKAYKSDVLAEAAILNMSFGGYNTDPEHRQLDAIRLAAGQDKIMVTSAGNDSRPQPDNISMIFLDPEVAGLGIVVVAANEAGGLADFANQCGAARHYCMSAPGVNINSTTVGGGYNTSSGASSAAPIVAGAAAVVMAAFPGVSPREVVARLFASGSNASTGPTSRDGWGLLDLNKAMNPIGQTGLSTNQSVRGVRVSVSNTSLVGTSVTGNLLGASKLASRAVVFDDMGFPFYAGLDQKSTVRQMDSLLAGFVTRRRGETETKDVAGKLRFRMNMRPDDRPALAMTFNERDTASPTFSGAVATRLLDTVWLSASFSEQVPALQEGAGGMTGQSGAPYAALLCLSDGFGIQVDKLLGGALNITHHWSKTGEWAVLDGGLTSFLQGRGQAAANTEMEASQRLTAISYRYALNKVGLKVSFGHLQEVNSLLGVRMTGAFASPDGSTTSYMAFAAETSAFGLNLSASYTVGRTKMGTSSLLRNLSNVRSEAFLLSASHQGLLFDGDRVSLSYAKPLTVVSGRYDLHLPVGRTAQGGVLYEDETVGFSGDDIRIVEANYAMHMSGGTMISFQAFSRWAEQRDVNSETGAGIYVKKMF